MTNVVGLPGVDISVRAGQPRPDMAQMLRDMADRAERGEFDALVVVASKSDGGIAFGKSTVSNAYYTLLGALVDAQAQIIRETAEPKLTAGYDPEGA